MINLRMFLLVVCVVSVACAEVSNEDDDKLKENKGEIERNVDQIPKPVISESVKSGESNPLRNAPPIENDDKPDKVREIPRGDLPKEEN